MCAIDRCNSFHFIFFYFYFPAKKKKPSPGKKIQNQAWGCFFFLSFPAWASLTKCKTGEERRETTHIFPSAWGKRAARHEKCMQTCKQLEEEGGKNKKIKKNPSEPCVRLTGGCIYGLIAERLPRECSRRPPQPARPPAPGARARARRPFLLPRKPPGPLQPPLGLPGSETRAESERERACASAWPANWRGPEMRHHSGTRPPGLCDAAGVGYLPLLRPRGVGGFRSPRNPDI